MLKSATSFLLFAGIISLVGQHANGDDWTQFLGPQRNGTSAEKNLINSWPADGPKIVWRTPLGVSMSGVAVADGAAFTMFQDESSQFVVCLNAADGKERWRTPVAPVFENAMGHGPRATPTVADGHVFAFTGEGILAAVKSDNGKLQWSVDVPKSLKGKPNEYGVSCSPLVTDGLVVVHSGTNSAAVAAFKIADGELAWQAGTGNAGYSSPVLMKLGEKTQIVSLTAAGAMGIEPASGKQLWSFPYPTEYDCNTASPVQLDDQHILISAGENHGSVIVALGAGKSGTTAESVWSSLGKDSQLRAEWQTPVIYEGHLYGLDNQGSAGPITNLVCVRLKDHKTMWQKNRFGKSNLILADGKLFLTTMEGEVVIVDASPKEFHELGRASIMETTRQAPALANGHLFVRDDKDIICIDVAGK
jgi:outer membrane protein assembly factor BamB